MDSIPLEEWTSTTIGNVIDIFDSKRIPLSGNVRKQRQGQYPYYGASGIIDYIDDYIFDGRYLLIAEDGENLNSRKLPVAFFAQGKFWVNNHAHIVRAKAGIADDHFLFSWFSQANISGYITGAAQPKLSQENLKRIELRMPPLPTQRKIAAILSAYDDLIENNLRRIKILEEMAQNLYREWFVKFRFPGHQQTRFIDSPLGKIPEGWRYQRLDELCSAVLDGDWIETKDQGGDDYRLLQISNIGLGDFVETGKFRYVTQETFDRIRCTEIRPNDLLIARMPTPIGRGWLARKMPWRIITAVDVAIARPDMCRISPVFLLHFWNQPSTLAAIEKQSSGTTRLRITRRELCAMPIPTPSLVLQEQFSAKAQPMLDLSNIMRDKNTTLRRTRDLLLPKLISGEVDVSELDITVPEEAA